MISINILFPRLSMDSQYTDFCNRILYFLCFSHYYSFSTFAVSFNNLTTWAQRRFSNKLWLKNKYSFFFFLLLWIRVISVRHGPKSGGYSLRMSWNTTRTSMELWEDPFSYAISFPLVWMTTARQSTTLFTSSLYITASIALTKPI